MISIRGLNLFVCLFVVLRRIQQSFSYIAAAGYLTRFLGFQPVHANSLLVAGNYPT